MIIYVVYQDYGYEGSTPPLFVGSSLSKCIEFIADDLGVSIEEVELEKTYANLYKLNSHYEVVVMGLDDKDTDIDIK